MRYSALWKIGMAFMLLWGLSWLVYTQNLLGDTQQRQKEAQFKSVKEAQIWFMGDSHPLLAVDPACIAHCFNWATRSESYLLVYYKLLHLLGQHPGPKVLVLPLEGHSFSEQGLRLWFQHELDDPYWSQIICPGSDSLTSSKAFLSWWIQARLFPFAGQYFNWKLFFKPERKLSPGGFFSDSARFCQSQMSATTADRVRSHYLKYAPFDTLQWQYLNRLREVCRQSGIRLIFIRYPVSEEYGLAAINTRKVPPLEQLVRSDPPKELIWDHRFIFKNHPCYFSDPDHLNVEGARQYSRYLNQLLKAILAQERNTAFNTSSERTVPMPSR